MNELIKTGKEREKKIYCNFHAMNFGVGGCVVLKVKTPVILEL